MRVRGGAVSEGEILMQWYKIPGQTATDTNTEPDRYDYVPVTEKIALSDSDTSALLYGLGYGYNQPLPDLREITIEVPKRPKPAALVKAKRKEQLKAWGLRR